MNLDKPIVAVMFGGQSTEHQISCRSAATVLRNISQDSYQLAALAVSQDGCLHPQNVSRLLQDDGALLEIHPNEPPDALSQRVHEELLSKFNGRTPKISPQHLTIFSTLHGTYGEDGCWQGFFELSGFAYVGPNVLGSALSMDKIVAKQLVAQADIAVAPYVYFTKEQWNSSEQAKIKLEITENLSFPCFVKPSSQGSSVGISKVDRIETLNAAVEEALSYDHKILVEKAISGREIEFAALGGRSAEITLPGEVASHNEDGFYTYESKYIKKDAASVLVPAPGLSNAIIAEGQKLSQQIFQLLNLECMARIDFFFVKDEDKFYFNEANTLPGFTSISQFPKLWEAMGISIEKLIDTLVRQGQRRAIEKAALQRSLDRLS